MWACIQPEPVPSSATYQASVAAGLLTWVSIAYQKLLILLFGYAVSFLLQESGCGAGIALPVPVNRAVFYKALL